MSARSRLTANGRLQGVPRGGYPEPADTATRPLTALIGCTWPIVAMSIREAAGRGGIHCSDVIADPRQLVAQVTRARPDLCLVVGPYAPHLTEVISQLAAGSRSTRSVVLAADDVDPAEVLAALSAGADGWLPLDTDSDRLVDALRAVARGETAVPRVLMSTVLAELRGVRARAVTLADGSIRNLAPRELDVLVWLGKGLSTADVSTRLAIGEATVRGYVASAVRKLGAPDRDTAIAMVTGRFGQDAEPDEDDPGLAAVAGGRR